jgi:hypothetical protein
MLKNLALLCFSVSLVYILYIFYSAESKTGFTGPSIEFKEVNDKGIQKKHHYKKSEEVCEASLYRVVDVRKSLKSPLIIKDKSVENQIIDSTTQTQTTYDFNNKFMRLLSNAHESKNWDVLLSSVEQGEFPLEGTFGGKLLSLFDVIFMTLVTQEVVSKLIEMNIRPTMYSFEYFSQFKHLGKSKLIELEHYYFPNIDYKVKYQGKKINLATYSQISKNSKAVEFWESKGLFVEQEKLRKTNLEKTNELKERIAASEKTTIAASDDIRDVNKTNNYQYFTLIKVKDCKYTNSIKAIDTLSNKELNSIFYSLNDSNISHEDKVRYLDEKNPLFTEVYLEKKRMAIEYQSIEAYNVVSNVDYFFTNVKKGIVNKNTRIYSSSPKNGLTILDYSLFFSLESDVISYLFENDFPLSLAKLSYMLTSKHKRNKIFESLESNNFDFNQVQSGKNLLHYAIKTGNIDLILYLKAKGIPLIENFGVDALEYTLRHINVKEQLDILEVISEFYPTIKKGHKEILNNLREYELDRYKALVQKSFLMDQVDFK